MAAKKTIVKPVVKSAARTAEAAVKVEAPKTADVKAEDKATTPEEPVKTEAEKKETAKKETVKRTTTKKVAAEKATAKKETEEKTSVDKEEIKAEICVQFADQSLTQADLVKIARDVWEYDLNQKADDLKTVELYVKPEERKTYYVMNGDVTGSFDI